MMIERDRCISNIYLLAKKQGIRIGDLENSCKVSIGYLARLRQDPKKPLPGSDFLFRAAAALGVTVDSLMSCDYRIATDEEVYLQKFVSQLITDSYKKKIVWNLDSDCFLSPVAFESENVAPNHPLIGFDPDPDNPGYINVYYSSRFHPKNRSLIPHDACRTSLSDNIVVYLISLVSESEGSAPEEPDKRIELYLFNKRERRVSPLCSKEPGKPGMLDVSLEELLVTVLQSLNRTALDPFAVSAIDEYMSKSSGRNP